MPGLLSSSAKATVEGFVGLQSSERRRDAYVEFTSVIIAFVVALVILGFVGKWLWNYAVVELFTFAKPARSVWQLLALMLFVSIIRP